MAMFDATVDFEAEGVLEAELMKAFKELGLPVEQGLKVHIPADGEGCEVGEMVYSRQGFSREVGGDDWWVNGTGVDDIARQLRGLL
jgi:hypothetical protein